MENMKTAMQRARELINPLDLSCEAQKDKIVRILVNALYEQDKLTRHSCADNITEECSVFDQGFFYAVSVTEAIEAIMNTKAV